MNEPILARIRFLWAQLPPDVQAAELKRMTPKARKSPIPPGFVPSERARAWAVANLPPIDLKAETLMFRDHHASKGTLFIDHDAAWRTWMRRAARSVAGKRPSVPVKDRADGIIERLNGRKA